MDRFSRLPITLGHRRALWLLGVVVLWIGTREHSPAIEVVAALLFALSFAPVGQGNRRYATEVHVARRQCVEAITAHERRFQESLTAHRTELTASPTPDSMLGLRTELLATAAVSDSGDVTSARIQWAVAHSETVRQLIAQLAAATRSPAERDYLTMAEIWWARRSTLLDESQIECERELSAAMARLSELSPPRALRSEHSELMTGLRAEYIAWATVHRALLDLDADAAVAGLAQFEPAREKIKATIAAIS